MTAVCRMVFCGYYYFILLRRVCHEEEIIPGTDGYTDSVCHDADDGGDGVCGSGSGYHNAGTGAGHAAGSMSE